MGELMHYVAWIPPICARILFGFLCTHLDQTAYKDAAIPLFILGVVSFGYFVELVLRVRRPAP